MRERLWKAALFVALLAATWLLLSTAGPDADVFPHADKLLHALLFAGLAIPARYAYPANPAWGIAAALLLYGIAIEVAQARVPGRSSDALDVLADAVGASAVFLLPRPRHPPA